MSLWMMLITLLFTAFPFYVLSGTLMDLLSSGLCWLTVGSMVLIYLANNKIVSLKSNIIQNLMFVSLLMSFTSYNLLSFYLWFEFSLIPMLIMLMLWGGNPERLSAMIYFVFYTSSISIPFFVIVMKLGTNVYLYSLMKLSVSSSILILMWMPFFIKLPLFSLHFWLPKAHVEASTSSSMLLAGLLLKLGSYGILRVTMFVLANAMSLLLFILTLSFISSMVTLIQSDVKKLIAYSSVTHMSFIIISVLFYNNLSYSIIILGSIIHGWISMCMFFTMGSISSIKMTRILFFYSSPMWLSLLMGFSLMANSAIPPNLSFLVELYLFMNSLSMNFLSMIPMMLMSLFICYYSVYVFMVMMHMQTLNSNKNIFINNSVLMILMLMWSIMSLWLL